MERLQVDHQPLGIAGDRSFHDRGVFSPSAILHLGRRGGTGGVQCARTSMELSDRVCIFYPRPPSEDGSEVGIDGRLRGCDTVLAIAEVVASSSLAEDCRRSLIPSSRGSSRRSIDRCSAAHRQPSRRLADFPGDLLPRCLRRISRLSQWPLCATMCFCGFSPPHNIISTTLFPDRLRWVMHRSGIVTLPESTRATSVSDAFAWGESVTSVLHASNWLRTGTFYRHFLRPSDCSGLVDFVKHWIIWSSAYSGGEIFFNRLFFLMMMAKNSPKHSHLANTVD